MILDGVAQDGSGVAMYVPVRQYNPAGHYINLNYIGPGTYNGLPELSTITRQDGVVLLTINRSASNPFSITV